MFCYRLDLCVPVQVSMEGPHGYISATEWPLMMVRTSTRRRSPAPASLTPTGVFFSPPVLHGHVHHLRADGRALAGSVRLFLEGPAQDPVLDRRRHLPGDAGESRLLRRVPEHQIRRAVR